MYRILQSRAAWCNILQNIYCGLSVLFSLCVSVYVSTYLLTV